MRTSRPGGPNSKVLQALQQRVGALNVNWRRSGPPKANFFRDDSRNFAYPFKEAA